MMNLKPRLKLTDSMPELLSKMTEGNFGAITVCIALIRQGGQIDPKAGQNGLMKIMGLDDLEIYGSNIWTLSQYVCGGRTDNVVLLLRSRQLGLISGGMIKAAISAQKSEFDFADLASKVKAEIGEFNWPYDKNAEREKGGCMEQ